MLARHFLVGIMALATLPSSSGQQVQEPPGRVLLTAAPLSDDIAALTVIEHSEGAGRQAYLEVQLGDIAVSGETESGQRSTPPVGASQAWLLRKDGTTVAQFDNDNPMGSPMHIWLTFGLRFAFHPVPASELAGVVVNVKGKLYVREIKAS
jgi:hypothetical protein